MKKTIVLLISLLVSFAVKAQFPMTQSLGSKTTLVQVPGGLSPDSVFRVPRKDTVHSIATTFPGALTYNTSGKKLYVSDGTAWQSLSGTLYVAAPIGVSSDTLSIDTTTSSGLATKYYVGGGAENFYFDAGNRRLGIQTQSPLSILDVSSTTSGFLPPRMTKAQRDAINGGVSIPVGTVIYQTDNTPGLRVYNGSNWMRFTETAD